MGTGWILMKWPRNGFVEMGFFERDGNGDEMES